MIGAIMPNVSIWNQPAGVVDVASAEELEQGVHPLGGRSASRLIV